MCPEGVQDRTKPNQSAAFCPHRHFVGHFGRPLRRAGDDDVEASAQHRGAHSCPHSAVTWPDVEEQRHLARLLNVDASPAFAGGWGGQFFASSFHRAAGYDVHHVIRSH